MSLFIPRSAFPNLDSLPRSYFLGHHRAGLDKMKSMLASIDLVIECRDYRVPITSHNPLFEANLGGKQRLVVYTKQDLGSNYKHKDSLRESIISRWHHPSTVLFSDHKNPRSVRKVLNFARKHAAAANTLVGSRMMVVGMPNVGKSSLLNALRMIGVNRGKAAQTGAQPGITRKIGTTVKIIEASEHSAGVYLMDTPGVFIPYVPDAEAMLKLALCGSVKDTVILPTIMADYLLYQINLKDSTSYAEFGAPTNDIVELLRRIARKTGRLQKGGMEDLEAAALWFIQQWRTGRFGKFLLDVVDQGSLEKGQLHLANQVSSMSQARKSAKDVMLKKMKKIKIDVA